MIELRKCGNSLEQISILSEIEKNTKMNSRQVNIVCKICGSIGLTIYYKCASLAPITGCSHQITGGRRQQTTVSFDYWKVRQFGNKCSVNFKVSPKRDEIHDFES